MDYLSSVRFNKSQISLDAMAKVRTSNAKTLHDGKSLNASRTILWETAGTGSGSFADNIYDMPVVAGQWLIRQSKRFYPYYSGKSQAVELTLDNFNTEADVVKRVGYFSSKATFPYDTNYDGFWLEDDGITKRIVSMNNGVETLNIPLADWNGEYDFSTYDWETFTVLKFDFLWLGGAVLRLFIDTPSGFQLAHSHIHAGALIGTFSKSPNQPVRYEIRSTTGSGNMRMICSEVESEGSTDEAGLGRSAYTANGITCASIGTTYPIISIRKDTAFRDVALQINSLWVHLTSNNDQAIWTLQANPTLSASLTYGAISQSGAQYAVGNGTITVTSPGTVLESGVVVHNTPITYNGNTTFLSYLGGTLDNIMDEYVLCVTLLTASVICYAGIGYLEY